MLAFFGLKKFDRIILFSISGAVGGNYSLSGIEFTNFTVTQSKFHIDSNTIMNYNNLIA